MTPAIISITPDPIAFSFGPINIGWYGIAYVVALGVLLWSASARRSSAATTRPHRQRLPDRPATGGHRWPALSRHPRVGVRCREPCYSENLLRIFLPPYAGLGLYGGVLGAAIGILIYTAGRRSRCPSRWTLSFRARCWRRASRAGATSSTGALRAAHRPAVGHRHRVPVPHRAVVLPWRSTVAGRGGELPIETTGFHPLFFYESALDILGAAIALFIVARFLPRLRPFDIAAFWGIWYGSTRRPRVISRRLGLDVGRHRDGAVDWSRPGDRRHRRDRVEPSPWLAALSVAAAMGAATCQCTRPARRSRLLPAESRSGTDEATPTRPTRPTTPTTQTTETPDEAPTQPRAGPATAGDLG